MQAIARWDHFFFDEIDPAPLGLFRVLIGSLITVSFIALYPNWQNYFGPGGMRIEPANLAGWSLFAWNPGWFPFQIFWWFGFGRARR